MFLLLINYCKGRDNKKSDNEINWIKHFFTLLKMLLSPLNKDDDRD